MELFIFIRVVHGSVWVGFGPKPNPTHKWSVSGFQNPIGSVSGRFGFSGSEVGLGGFSVSWVQPIHSRVLGLNPWVLGFNPFSINEATS